MRENTRKASKYFIVGLITLFAMYIMTGCGKSNIDVMENVQLEFNGANGHGTANIIDEYTWEISALEAAGLSDSDDLHALFAIECAVTYKITPNENLSNGDEVTITAVVDNDSVEKYNICFSANEKKVIVEGLKEVEEVDLFTGVNVEFSGLGPYINASLENSSNLPFYVNYTLDKDAGLDIGDVIKVTAEYNEEKLLQDGYIAKYSTKEFTVPECDRYASTISEIPNDIIDKMNKQHDDAFRAYAASHWSYPDSLMSIDYIGGYFLTPKKGMDAWDKNLFYGVYKINVSGEDGNFSYYTYCCFKDVIILKDGTCSVDLTGYKTPENSSSLFATEGFTKNGLSYLGYEELTSLFNNCITKNIEYYEYESFITEDEDNN